MAVAIVHSGGKIHMMIRARYVNLETGINGSWTMGRRIKVKPLGRPPGCMMPAEQRKIQSEISKKTWVERKKKKGV